MYLNSVISCFLLTSTFGGMKMISQRRIGQKLLYIILLYYKIHNISECKPSPLKLKNEMTHKWKEEFNHYG